MTGTLGFSRVGLAFLLALLAPNLLWRRCKGAGQGCVLRKGS